MWWTKWHWDRFFSEYFGFPLSISFHRCSTTRKRTKNNNHHRHLHHRVAQEASRLRCVRSVCRGGAPIRQSLRSSNDLLPVSEYTVSRTVLKILRGGGDRPFVIYVFNTNTPFGQLSLQTGKTYQDCSSGSNTSKSSHILEGQTSPHTRLGKDNGNLL
jgi:hypothetical protein